MYGPPMNPMMLGSGMGAMGLMGGAMPSMGMPYAPVAGMGFPGSVYGGFPRHPGYGGYGMR